MTLVLDNTPHDPIQTRASEFGLFPEAARFNPRFVPGREKHRLTVDVLLAPDGPPDIAGLTDGALALAPGLAFHTCRGGRPIGPPAARVDDPIVEIAHLVEHLIIEFQHQVAGMRLCSGATCAYDSPRTRCDLFIESPDRGVSRLCARLAIAWVNAFLSGRGADPRGPALLRLAGHAFANAGSAITAQTARASGGDTRAAMECLRILEDAGFLEQVTASVNFSGSPLYTLRRLDTLADAMQPHDS
ncbi:MAG TPA: hypothetical protein VFG76_00565 [Candidatus Polarisedimenticolia bacterium]|nr:hypothetical protein [Candidatus Polarisedimenticolia bacterium]